MKHLGDITKIHGFEVPVVNVVIGGSPCQDLSIAGKRAGLAGERSGLFMEQIRIIKEMRKADIANGRTGSDIRPRFMLWENVPGAFSSNRGEDFAAVLQETARVVNEEAPAIPVPKNGWPTAGCLSGMGNGGGFSIAWRVLDAQFWGVPQRRRRIALVADFGGITAPEILFERESVSRDIAQGSAEGQNAPANARRGTNATVNSGTGCNIYNGRNFDPLAFHLTQDPISGPISPCLSSGSANGQCVCGVVEPVAAPYCIQGNCIDRADTAGCNGRGWAEDVSYTLNTIDRHAVAYSVENHPQDSRVKINEDGICQTLDARMGTGGGNVPMILEGFSQTAYDKYEQEDSAVATLKANGGNYGGE